MDGFLWVDGFLKDNYIDENYMIYGIHMGMVAIPEWIPAVSSGRPRTASALQKKMQQMLCKMCAVFW